MCLLLLSLPQQPDGRFGKQLDRGKIKGSPVVPGSTAKLFEDGESALYTVTILKGQYEAGFYEGDTFQQGVFVDYVENFKNKARERRFVIRSFTFDPNAASASTRTLDDHASPRGVTGRETHGC